MRDRLSAFVEVHATLSTRRLHHITEIDVPVLTWQPNQIRLVRWYSMHSSHEIVAFEHVLRHCLLLIELLLLLGAFERNLRWSSGNGPVATRIRLLPRQALRTALLLNAGNHVFKVFSRDALVAIDFGAGKAICF